jgi:ankyrin repeat protein
MDCVLTGTWEAVADVLVEHTGKDRLRLLNCAWGTERLTPLGYAVFYRNNLLVARRLLVEGALVNAADNLTGDTPLHLAAEKFNYEAAGILLPYGANHRLSNRDGEIAMQVCERSVSKNAEEKTAKRKILEALRGKYARRKR